MALDTSIETRNSIKKDIFAVLIYRVRDISRNSFDNVVIIKYLRNGIRHNPTINIQMPIIKYTFL